MVDSCRVFLHMRPSIDVFTYPLFGHLVVSQQIYSILKWKMAILLLTVGE